jgi:hypothetical protein
MGGMIVRTIGMARAHPARKPHFPRSRAPPRLTRDMPTDAIQSYDEHR